MAHPIDANHVQEVRASQGAERSIGDLFSDLTREMTTLVKQEVSLAKTEMSRKAAKAGRDVGFLAAGGAILYAGFLALIAALIIGLGQAGVTWWLSALIVGLIVAAVGGFLVWKGMDNLKRADLAPTQTLDTLKEDTTWAKEQVT